jgi:hypothetical protein
MGTTEEKSMYPETATTQYAGNVSGLSGGAQAGKMVLGASSDRPMTEIEACTAQLADSARRLQSLADRLQSRVDGFMQTCEATNPAPPNIEPQPGTLGALKYFQGRIDSQCDRLHAHLNTLAGIL